MSKGALSKVDRAPLLLECLSEKRCGVSIIKCGYFFDGINEEVRENIEIRVDGKRIMDIGENLEHLSGEEIIDLSEYFVTPGLIDNHVHYDLVGPDVLTTYAFTDSDEMMTLNTVYCAQKALENGFTTVRIVGSALAGFGQIDAKRAIDRKMFPAARLVVSPHALDISGGHWDFSTFAVSNPALSEFMEKRCAGTGNGVDYCRTIVRKYVKYGADFVKIMATGGFASPIDTPDEQAFSDEEMKTIIDTAAMFHKPVVAHAYASDLVNKLIDFGITEIEHAALIDEKTAEKLENSSVILTPTLLPFEEIVENDEENLSKKNDSYKEKLSKFGERLIATRKIILNLINNRKMLIGFGSDIVSAYNNWDSWREFKAWRDNGISALRTLVAATGDNAKIIGREDLGKLQVGKVADIAAWKPDILDNHEALKECVFVMKDGDVYKQP